MRSTDHLPESLRAAVAAEARRAVRPPFEMPLVVLCNGLLVVLFWFSPWSAWLFDLHGALAFPVALGSWMYADVPATNVIGSDVDRMAKALDDPSMVMRLLAAKASLLWLMVAPLCLVVAVVIGIVEGRLASAGWTILAIAVVPLGALAVSSWVGFLWPYRPVPLATRWRERREVRTQLRWAVLVVLPYGVVPAVFVVVSLPSIIWWWLATGGSLERIPDGLFAELTLVAVATSLVVFLAGRAGTRRLLQRRRDRLRAWLADPHPY